jgi:hypothetical protein
MGFVAGRDRLPAPSGNKRVSPTPRAVRCAGRADVRLRGLPVSITMTPVPRPNRPSPGREPAAFVQPMTATVVQSSPEGDEWIYEVKLDAYRALAIKEGSHV